MGYFVPPKIYWPLIQSQVSDNRHLAGIYAILACLLKYGTKEDISQKLRDMVSFLAEDDVCETRNVRLNSASKLPFLIREEVNFDLLSTDFVYFLTADNIKIIRLL